MSGFKKMCILSGVEFETKDRDQNISPLIIQMIVREMIKDKDLKREVVSAAFQDADCLKLMAQAVMSQKASDCGLSAPGTLAEFFCEMRKKRAKRKASKADKEV